jgi:hypothetical protein
MAMNTRKLTLLFTALVGLAASAFAQSTATEATVARVTGTVTATLADGSTVAVTEGTKLPQGATITTGDKSEAYLVSHGDTTSKISENSVVEIAELSTTSAGGKVTEQKATLDLKSGNLVAKLNPAKKSVNQYSVRTPKGVAAARGTVFTVSYKGGTYTIAVVNGVVTVTPPSAGGGITTTSGNSTNAGVQVNAGQAIATDNSGVAYSDSQLQTQYRTQSLTDLANNSNGPTGESVRELMALAVATITVAAQNNIGGTTAAEAASVASAVFAAVPAAAEQAGAIIAQSNAAKPPADAAAAAAVMQAVTTATPEAAKAALTSGATTGTFTPSPQSTSTDTPATSPGNTNRNDSSPQQVTTPQPIDPATVSRSGE